MILVMYAYIFLSVTYIIRTVNCNLEYGIKNVYFKHIALLFSRYT
jgi:hypothetical protein